MLLAPFISGVCYSLLLNSIPLQEYSTLYSYFLLFMDIYVLALTNKVATNILAHVQILVDIALIFEGAIFRKELLHPRTYVCLALVGSTKR